MNATFDLSTSSPHLETNSTSMNTFLKLAHRSDTNILQGMLNTGVEIGKECLDASFVLHVPRDALCDLDGGGFGEVPGCGCVFVRGGFGRGGVFGGAGPAGEAFCGGGREGFALFHRFLHMLEVSIVFDLL